MAKRKVNKEKNSGKSGRPRNFNEPKDLLNAWKNYKDHVDNTPDVVEEITVKGEIVKKKIRRPYLKEGFLAFCFNEGYGDAEHYLDGATAPEIFRGVVSHIQREWREDQFSGAITGRYKSATLIGNLNNVAQQVNNNTTQKIEIKGINDDDLQNIISDDE